MTLETIFKLSQELPVTTEEQTPPEAEPKVIPAPSPDDPQTQAPVGKMDTFVNPGKKGFYLAVSVSGTPEIVKKVSTQLVVGPNSWREFRGKLTNLVTTDNIDRIQKEVEDVARLYNVELNNRGIMYARHKLLGEEYQRAEGGVKSEDLIIEGDIDATMNNLAEKFHSFAKGIPAAERSKQIAEVINRYLDQLANDLDEAKQQDFIQAFLRFASNMYNYSYGNQMLAFIQTAGKATKIQSYNKWRQAGRFVKKEGKEFGPIDIWVPISKKLTDESQQPVIDPDTGEVKTRTLFILGPVYDVIDTEPFSGNQLLKWQKKMQKKDIEETGTGKELNEYQPYEPSKKEWWQSSENEDTDETVILRDAALKYAKSKGIDIDLSQDTGQAGGYSAGRDVSIDVKSYGLQQLATTIHEIAHSLIHWVVDAAKKQKSKRTKDLPKDWTVREVDAEATAHIVLTHFGFENLQESLQYMALVGGSGSVVKMRKDVIQKTAKQIIEGIYDNIPQQVESMGKNWYKVAKNLSKI